MSRPNGARVLPVRNPYTGAVDYEITAPAPDELARTCDRLRAAQVKWAAASLEHRIDVLTRWADELEKAYAALAAADSEDTGGCLISLMAPRIAVVKCGGPPHTLGGGQFMRPTVLTEVSHDMLLMREESFAPFLPVMRYRTEDEAPGRISKSWTQRSRVPRISARCACRGEERPCRLAREGQVEVDAYSVAGETE